MARSLALAAECSAMRSALCYSAILVLATISVPVLYAETEPVFIVRTAAGKEVRGSLRKIDADWSIEIGTGTVRKIAGAELVSLRQQGTALPPLPTDEHVILANGDRLPVQDLRLVDEKLTFLHKDLGGDTKLSVPLAAVSVLWRMAPDGVADPPESFRRRLGGDKRTRDRILLRNGDTIEGNLQSITPENVQLEVNKKTVTALWKQTAAIALSTELADRLRPKGPYARVVLTEPTGSSGGRLTLTEATCDGTTVRGKTTFGATVRFPLRRVAQLGILGSTAVALEEITPSKYEHLAYTDLKWAWSANGNVLGRDMRLGGSTYDRGIGMHAHSLLSFPLNGAYRRFETLVGLDQKDGRDGSVRVKVLLDGRAVDLGKKGVLTHAGGPLRINVDVAGANTLTLEVENGENGPVRTVVNWVEARLVK
jgi:hypothetical protein